MQQTTYWIQKHSLYIHDKLRAYYAAISGAIPDKQTDRQKIFVSYF